MKKLILSVLFLLFTASFAAAQTCDCKIVPYNPASCFSPCTASLIVDSTLEELLIVIGLKKETAEKIVEYNEKNKTKKTRTIEEYKAVLKDEELKELENKLQSLNEGQINYFQISVKERKDERAKLARIYRDITALENTITITTRVQ
ncbi:MAG TPA: hypothetical protein VNB22_23705 [Pyrinomonadaceae bacterium]|jgi:Skp family chaperone for outer membrane proteins|nr:hypothetical protein [Pyrinomonadaceae bacterium]